MNGVPARREQLLRGELDFPKQIRDIVNPLKKEALNLLIDDLWSNIWYKFLNEQHTDTLHFLEIFEDHKLFNKLIVHLSKSGWITSHTTKDYAYITLNESKLLKWLTKEEITNLKFKYKFIKYRLTETHSDTYDLAKINGKYQKTGLIRKGFAKAGNHVFKYDTRYLKIYLREIAINLKKGLSASTKDITYQEIIQELAEYYSVEDAEYTLGRNISDSRGRAIFQCTRKIFNPIASKDARALLICPSDTLVSEDYDIIYAAIAELNGYRGKNYPDKVREGQNMYLVKELPDITIMDLTEDYSDLHKRIWLERIYENLDNYAQTQSWNVPIEIDCAASALEHIGVLTNDINYMLGTNMIPGENFQDIWSQDYASRTHIKKAVTPQIYGSSRHSKELWVSNKLDYTQTQVNAMEKDLNIGTFANACKFKDFIINNVQPKEEMEVNINGERFRITCNRFKWEETALVAFFVYDSIKGHMVKIVRRLNLVPDPEQFKRYFATLCIHNLDSQVANYICENVDWVIPIHDSFTSKPSTLHKVCKLYTDWMMELYRNRKQVLKDYFLSIGITRDYPEQEHNYNIKEFSPYCMK